MSEEKSNTPFNPVNLGTGLADNVVRYFLPSKEYIKRVENAAEQYANGNFVVVINQGIRKWSHANLGFALTSSSPEKIAEFMHLVNNGGQFSVAVDKKIIEELNLPSKQQYFDPDRPSFRAVVDSYSGGTGIQAIDRFFVIQDIYSQDHQNQRFQGHTAILESHENFLKGRKGSAESYNFLARLSGSSIRGSVMQELFYRGQDSNKWGKYLWGDDLLNFISKNKFAVVGVTDLFKYQTQLEKSEPDTDEKLSISFPLIPPLEAILSNKEPSTSLIYDKGIPPLSFKTYTTTPQQNYEDILLEQMPPKNFEDRVNKAIEAFKNGEFVIIIDGKKEFEADLGFLATDKLTEIKVAEFMNIIGNGGNFCVGLTENMTHNLNLGVDLVNFDPEKPNYLRIVNSSSALSGCEARDRYLVIKDLLFQDYSNLMPNGRTYLLKSHPQLLSARKGHTEAFNYLATLANANPVITVFQELMYIDSSSEKKKPLTIVPETSSNISNLEENISNSFSNNNLATNETQIGTYSKTNDAPKNDSNNITKKLHNPRWGTVLWYEGLFKFIDNKKFAAVTIEDLYKYKLKQEQGF